jgi:hypothetical protein
VVRVGSGASEQAITAVMLRCRVVIGPTGAVRGMVATRPVDFRKGAQGLAALVREEMKADPFCGAGLSDPQACIAREVRFSRGSQAAFGNSAAIADRTTLRIRRSQRTSALHLL